MNSHLITVVFYTFGSGSGHLTRANAVFRGFQELGCRFQFHLIAPRSKYLALRSEGIQMISFEELPPRIDIFICDWRYTPDLEALERCKMKRCFALCRLGKIPRRFPPWFETIAIEPGVRGDQEIWPLISTFKCDLLSRSDSREALKLPQGEKCVFLFENGCYPKHVEQIFEEHVPQQWQVFRSTCNPAVMSCDETARCYPIARYLNAADLIIAGAGYNTTHEVRTLAPDIERRLVVVGGDDQRKRVELEPGWPKRHDSAALDLAKFMIAKV